MSCPVTSGTWWSGRCWPPSTSSAAGRPGWRWLALAPLAFIAATPSVLVSVFADGGIGGGAIAVPLCAMAGGYAVSGRGPVWGRVLAGLFGLIPIAGLPLVVALDGGVPTARDGWAVVLATSFVTVLALACAIPHRPVVRAVEEAPTLARP